MDRGLRYNSGKLRYDLIPVNAEREFVKVLTVGAEKYSDRNWERGMQWSKVVASMRRHIAAFQSGEDFDSESGLLHTAHIMANAAFLTEYYSIYRIGDDRRLNRPILRVGLDIDEVLADFIGAFMSKVDGMERSRYWHDWMIRDNFEVVAGDVDFWMGIAPKIDRLPFEPVCYITSRPVDVSVSEAWIKKCGFPYAPVINVGKGEKKSDVAKQYDLDVFVDDRFENFVEMNEAGVFCYLFDAPHNEMYDVGFKRIKSLNEIKVW